MSSNSFNGPGSPLLSWDDVQRHLWLSRPDVDSHTESNIATLLSASSYPLPGRNDYSENAPSGKKRGRPLKDLAGLEGLDNKERRRLQMRRAQRAYQLRREANVSFLNRRIAHLETSMQQMSTAVVSFKDQLVQSGILASYNDLAVNLQDTVQECLDLTKETNMEDDPAASDASPQNGFAEDTYLASNGPESLTSSLSIDGNSPRIDPSHPARPATEDATDLSAFIERLHIACVYQGYLTLSNPSTSLDYIRSRFRLLLSIMDRETLESYFEAALHARIYQTRLENWGEVPLFSLGDAGTHSRRYKARSSSWEPYRSYPEPKVVEDPLSRFSPEIQEELSGEWFDICDLEEYLREKGVCLLADPLVEATGNTTHAVNTAKLMKLLVSRAICLGRAPGFRRFDVEEALGSCSMDVKRKIGKVGVGLA